MFERVLSFFSDESKRRSILRTAAVWKKLHLISADVMQRQILEELKEDDWKKIENFQKSKKERDSKHGVKIEQDLDFDIKEDEMPFYSLCVYCGESASLSEGKY